MRKIKIIIYILLIVALSSCSSETIKKEIYGPWGIDTLMYNNEDCLSKLYVNYIYFDNKNAILPISGERCAIKNNYQEGIWKISNLQSKHILTIETKNYFFKEREFELNVIYYSNYKKKILRIKSDSLYLIGSRIER